MPAMTPRERVMTALRRGKPDRVPWVENDIEEEIQIELMGGRTDYTPGELCRALGMDGFGYHFPSGGKAKDGQAVQTTALTGKEAWYRPSAITFDFTPPWIAEMGVDAATGRTYIKRGLLTDRDSLKYFDEFLPDPDHPGRYEQIAKWLEKYREDLAVFARIRLGSASTFECMGLDVFSIAMYEEPDLVKEVHRRFSEWSARVVQHLNKMDFDFICSNDDHADTKDSCKAPCLEAKTCIKDVLGEDDAGKRRAGHDAGEPRGEQARGQWMKPVDVLGRRNGLDHLARIDLRRQRQLHQDSMHRRVLVQLLD